MDEEPDEELDTERRYTMPDEAPFGAFDAQGVVAMVKSRRAPHRGICSGDHQATASYGWEDDRSQKSIKHHQF